MRKSKFYSKYMPDMEVHVEKITGIDLMQWACSMTTGRDSKMSLEKIYKCEHSPMRTQLFKVEMINIPSFVSVHFVRHNVGVDHFVRTNRDDRPEHNDERGRWQPVNHGMLINAQALVNMGRKRLCKKAHVATRIVMQEIKNEVAKVDIALAERMVPECIYRGLCPELIPCNTQYI